MTAAAVPDDKVLSVSHLTVEYDSGHGVVLAVDDVSFELEPGMRLGIAGESGSGKSTVGLTLAGLLPNSARIASGSVRLAGRNLVGLSERQLREIRGRDVALIFQDAKLALDPVKTVGYQLLEALRAHRQLDNREALARAELLLSEAEIPDPRLRLRQYPHQLSGGLRQRAMLAIALAAEPKVLVADEPTSALDVTTQTEIMATLGRLSEDHKMAVVLITHDLSVLANFANYMMILYAGRVMELGATTSVMRFGRHPYTRALVESIPRLDEPRLARLRSIPGNLPDLTQSYQGCIFEPRCRVGNGLEECKVTRPILVPTALGHGVACHHPVAAPLLQPREDATVPREASAAEAVGDHGRRRREDEGVLIEMNQLDKTFRVSRGVRARRAQIRALSGVTLSIGRSEALGIVGESGSGKTTLGRVIAGLERVDAGSVTTFSSDGHSRSSGNGRIWRSGEVQMIFQDPSDSLDPTMRVESIVTEPLVITRGGRAREYRDDAATLLERVGLTPDLLQRRPADLSGGQRQRIAIARAISTHPSLIVADEAVASLDMSARGHILNLLRDLQETFSLAFVHISHDLSMVRHIADRVCVMYAGEIVEIGDVDGLFEQPRHPYTRALIASVPSPDPDQQSFERALVLKKGDVPELTSANLSSCPFAPRCPKAERVCWDQRPALELISPGRWVACHLPVGADEAHSHHVAGEVLENATPETGH